MHPNGPRAPGGRFVLVRQDGAVLGARGLPAGGGLVHDETPRAGAGAGFDAGHGPSVGSPMANATSVGTQSSGGEHGRDRSGSGGGSPAYELPPVRGSRRSGASAQLAPPLPPTHAPPRLGSGAKPAQPPGRMGSFSSDASGMQRTGSGVIRPLGQRTASGTSLIGGGDALPRTTSAGSVISLPRMRHTGSQHASISENSLLETGGAGSGHAGAGGAPGRRTTQRSDSSDSDGDTGDEEEAVTAVKSSDDYSKLQ